MCRITAHDLGRAGSESDEAKRIVDVSNEEILVCCAQVVVYPRKDHQDDAFVATAEKEGEDIHKRD